MLSSLLVLIIIFTDFYLVQHAYYGLNNDSKSPQRSQLLTGSALTRLALTRLALTWSVFNVLTFNLCNSLNWTRYFPILSVLALSTTSMATGLLYRDYALADLVARGEQTNIALTQTLTNSLGTQLRPMLQASATEPQVSLKSEEQVQLFHQSILDQMQALSITCLKILDRQGSVLFSTDPVHLGQDRRQYQNVAAAQWGQVVTNLDIPKTLADFS